MDASFLYHQIAEAVRQDILSGRLRPGDRLPTVRQMAQQWGCTIGTVQHAYRELAQLRLVSSRAGQGTKVAARIPADTETPQRRAMLTHRAEAFLLEALTGGHTLTEVESAWQQALDRWRQIEQEPAPTETRTLRFMGSHDLALTWLASHFPAVAPGYRWQLQFTGSLGGLMGLAQGRADLAGAHLWDQEQDSYNESFVRRLLPGRRVALVTLAERRIGLLLAPGNPQDLHSLVDLARRGVRFVNRQAGSGTRVWLDANLHRLGLAAKGISGYTEEQQTHSAVAQAVAEGRADVGLGLEAAALAFGLDFVFLTRDRYDLVIPDEQMSITPLPQLLDWLRRPETAPEIEAFGGYDTAKTGQIIWID